MKVLLTGKTGFIGGHLNRHLGGMERITELHCTVRRIEDKSFAYDHICDLSDRFQVQNLLTTIKPDVIVHFAANPTTKLDFNNPTLITQQNTVSTQHLLHYGPKECRFIYASSVLVYGDTPDYVNESSPCNPTSVYGASKLASEALVSAYTNMGLVNGVSLRLSAIVGSGLTHGILRDFCAKLNSNEPIFEIFGECPGSSKPFTHIYDVCNIVDALITGHRMNGVYNVSNNDHISAMEIAGHLMSLTNNYKPIKFLGEKSTWLGDNKLLQIKNDKIRFNLVGQFKYNSSAAAIKQAIKDIYGLS